MPHNVIRPQLTNLFRIAISFTSTTVYLYKDFNTNLPPSEFIQFVKIDEFCV